MISRSKTTALLLIVAMIGAGAGAYQLRHRIRQMLDRRAEEGARQSLHVPSSESRPQPKTLPVQVGQDDWPWWRGRHHDNHATGRMPPLNWNETNNVRWKTAIPGRGHSSPIVLGNQVFLTTALEAERIQQILCVNTETGSEEWTTTVHQGEFIHSNPRNSHASATVATDGHQVFVVFAIKGSIWLSAVTRDGSITWQREAGPYISKEGFAASPLVTGDVVIVAADQVNQSWVAAFHRTSGQLIWRVPRGPGTSYASPILIEDGPRDLIVLAGLNRIAAIDPMTGNEVWNTDGPDMSASTPVAADGRLFVSGCTQDSGWFGVRLPAPSPPPEILWKRPMKAEIPSPLVSNERVYFVQDIGIVNCLDVLTGKEFWKKRLGGNSIASPVLISDHVLVTLEDGKTVVFRDSPQFEQVADNQLDVEAVFATPTICGGRIYLRSTTHLYLIQASQPPGRESIENLPLPRPNLSPEPQR